MKGSELKELAIIGTVTLGIATGATLALTNCYKQKPATQEQLQQDTTQYWVPIQHQPTYLTKNHKEEQTL